MIQLPTVLLLTIIKYDISISVNHSRGARWLSLYPSLRRDDAVMRMFEDRWVFLDLQKQVPYYRTQAAMDGNVDVFARHEPEVWQGLGVLDELCESKLVCHEPGLSQSPGESSLPHHSSCDPKPIDILNNNKNISTVLRITRRRGTYNRNIDLLFPRFKRKADADAFLDCWRDLVGCGDIRFRSMSFFDILCILCREDGPFPVRDASDITTSPAAALIIRMLQDNRKTLFFPRT